VRRRHVLQHELEQQAIGGMVEVPPEHAGAAA